MIAALVDIAEVHGLADLDRARRPAVSCPVMMLNSVDLPAPLGPITPTMPPGGSMKDRSSNSSLSP